MFLLVGVLFFAIVVAVAGVLATGQRPVPWDVWVFAFAPVAVLAGGFGAWSLATGLRCTGLRVELAPEGVGQSNVLSQTFWRGEDVGTFWYNADGTYLQMRRPTAATYTLVDRAGQKLRLRGAHLDGADQLNERLLGEVRRHLLPAAQRAVLAGGGAPFGPLPLSREGASGPAGLLPWADLAGLELADGGAVIVRRRGQENAWFVSPMSRIPDIPVLFALAAEWGSREGAAAPAGDMSEAGREWQLDRLEVESLEVVGRPEFVCRSLNGPGGPRAGALVCFALGLLGVAAGAVVIARFQAAFSPTMPANLVGGCAILFGPVVGALGFVQRVEAAAASITLHVFAHGFARVDSGGAWLCPWGRVRRIWADATVHVMNGQFAGRSLTYTVERDEGENVVVTSALNRVEDFHHRLQEETPARLLVGALSDLREGRTGNFGPIRATPDGLLVGAETHPWPTEGPAVLHEGIIRLPRVGRSPTVVLASEVANLVVVLERLQRRVAARGFHPGGRRAPGRGCDSADVLDHCRGPGPHARGCGVVDLVLGKE